MGYLGLLEFPWTIIKRTPLPPRMYIDKALTGFFYACVPICVPLIAG